MSDQHAIWLKAMTHRAESFLAQFLHWLGIAARGSYATTGNDLQDAYERLRAFNEVTIIASAQARSLTAKQLAYPWEVFLDVVLEQAETGGIRADAEWALTRASGERSSQS